MREKKGGENKRRKKRQTKREIKRKNTKVNDGPGSSVGIATGYGLDGPGIESKRLCVLASGTQDRGFAPDRSRRIFH
jgi:hypothetical protein